MNKINKFIIDLDERNIKDDHILIVPLGDLHYGHENFNEDLFNKVYDWILKNKNIFVIGMGDYMEMADAFFGTKHQQESADDQINYMKKIFKPLADEGRLIGLHFGNHEFRPDRRNYANPVRTICNLLEWKYLGTGIINHIILRKNGKEEIYKIYTTHGGTGSYTSGGRINAIKRLRTITDAECFCMGHTHDLQHTVQDFYDSNTGENTPLHFIQTGAYLEYWDSYAHRKGYEPARQGSPKIKLHVNEHRISVSEA